VAQIARHVERMPNCLLHDYIMGYRRKQHPEEVVVGFDNMGIRRWKEMT
jgi:hypothetical protein